MHCYTTVFGNVLFDTAGINLLLSLPDNTVLCIYYVFFPSLHKNEVPLSPEQVMLLWFLGTAGETQDLEHIREGAAVSRLGDEDGATQEKDEEGHPEARGGNAVAEHKVYVLLDVGHTSQRQDGSQVDAPVEPVKEPSCGLWSSVFDLRSQAERPDFLHLNGRCSSQQNYNMY